VSDAQRAKHRRIATRTIPVVVVLVAPMLLALCLLFGASGVGVPASEAILIARLHRVLCGFVVGAALSCAGVILQAVLRNPLAEPYVLGVSGGAGLGAAVAIVSGLAGYGVAMMPAMAFIFAVVTLTAVYLLARTDGEPTVYGLILSGVIVSAMCSSLLMFLVSRASHDGLRTIMWWMLGSLQVSSANLLIVCSAVIGLATTAAWCMSKELNALTLGKEAAHYVGFRSDVIVGIALAIATLLAATAVSVAGLIGFVGLIVPHVSRRLVGADHRRLVLVASVGGGVFLALCDAAGRSILGGAEIPVGVMTAFLGGPFFLHILRSRKNRWWI
jgi:iron complex transport system permease protein